MPIYAYRCESCGHAKDVLQKISDPVLTVCPACNAETFKKQLTAAGFQLKGSGWYVTDFRGGNTGSNTSGTSSSTGGDKPSEPAKSESPPSDSSSGTPSASAGSAGGPSAGCGGSCACH